MFLPATEGCRFDGEASAYACELEASPSLLSRGLFEFPDAATSLKALILGLSVCCVVGESGTASLAPAAALTRALKPLGLAGFKRERGGCCTGASSEVAPPSSPDVLLKESSDVFAMFTK